MHKDFGTTDLLRWGHDGNRDGDFFAGGAWHDITQENWDLYGSEDYKFTFEELKYYAGREFNLWAETDDGKNILQEEYTDDLHDRFDSSTILKWDNRTARFWVDGNWHELTEDNYTAHAGDNFGFTWNELQYYAGREFNVWAESDAGKEVLQTEYIAALDTELANTDLLRWNTETRSTEFLAGGTWWQANEANLKIWDERTGWDHFSLAELEYYGHNEFSKWAETTEGSEILQKEYTDTLHGKFEDTTLLRFDGQRLSDGKKIGLPTEAGNAQFFAGDQWWDVTKENVDIRKGRGWDHFTFDELKYYESLEVKKRPGEVTFRANVFQDMIAPYTDMLKYDADHETHKTSIKIDGTWYGLDQANYDTFVSQGHDLPAFSDLQHWGSLQQHEIDEWEATKDHYNTEIEKITGGNRFSVALAILSAEGEFKTFLTRYKNELTANWETSDGYDDMQDWMQNPRNQGKNPRSRHAAGLTLLGEALFGTLRNEYGGHNQGGNYAIPIGVQGTSNITEIPGRHCGVM